LKTQEKIKRKAFRKSLEKEKLNSAKAGPAKPREHASPDRWTPPASDRPRPCTISLSLSPFPLSSGTDLSAPTHPRSWPLLLADRWDLPVSADRPFARSPSLVYGPRLSATPLFPNLLPTLSVMDATTTTRFPAMTLAPKLFSAAHAHALTPLTQLHPQLNCLALSLALRTRPWNSDEGSPPFRDHRRVFAASVASVSSAPSPATRDTFWFAPSLSVSPGPRSPAFSPCSRSPLPSTRGIPASLPLLRCSRVTSRGEQSPYPYVPISCSVLHVIAHRSRPTPPLGRSAPALSPRLSPSCHPECV
jgi:hypothetical protein